MIKHYQEEYNEQCGLPPATAYYTIIESDISRREIDEEDAVRFEGLDMSKEELSLYLKLEEIDPSELDNPIFTMSNVIIDKDYDGYLYFSEYLDEYLTDDDIDNIMDEARCDFENNSEVDFSDPYDEYIDRQLMKDY